MYQCRIGALAAAASVFQRCMGLGTSIEKSYRSRRSCRCFRQSMYACTWRHVSIQRISLYSCRSGARGNQQISQRTPTLHGLDPGMHQHVCNKLNGLRCIKQLSFTKSVHVVSKLYCVI